jgi:hypothetical protein
MASLKEKLVSVFKSVIPVVSLVFILLLAFTNVGVVEIAFFLLCVAMVVIGITLFLLGTEAGIIPASRAIGADIPRRKSILFMFVVVFAISFLVTFADPDVMIFVESVNGAFPSMNVMKLMFMISGGVGFLLIVAALRIVYNLSQRLLFMIGYGTVLLLCIMVPPEYFAMCFDAGAVAPGPISIPVIVALGLGLCSALSSRSEMDGFGLLGMAMIGPMIGVMLFCIYTGGSEIVVPEPASYEFTVSFLADNAMQSVKNVAIALIPVLLFFAVFQKVLLKYPWSAVRSMLVGVFIAGIGMIVFLTGVYTGFLPVATEVGESLAEMNAAWVILLGFAIGLLATVAEPTVMILCGQVEKVSNGVLKSKLLIIVLGLGVASFVAIGMGRIIFEIDLRYILIPGFIAAITLMAFTDKSLTGVAFDAGAVAGGPMGVTLVMTMCAGLAIGLHGNAGAAAGSFGIIAMMVLAPMIFVSALGVVIKIYKKRSVGINDIQK